MRLGRRIGRCFGGLGDRIGDGNGQVSGVILFRNIVRDNVFRRIRIHEIGSRRVGGNRNAACVDFRVPRAGDLRIVPAKRIDERIAALICLDVKGPAAHGEIRRTVEPPQGRVRDVVRDERVDRGVPFDREIAVGQTFHRLQERRLPVRRHVRHAVRDQAMQLKIPVSRVRRKVAGRGARRENP